MTAQVQNAAVDTVEQLSGQLVSVSLPTPRPIDGLAVLSRVADKRRFLWEREVSAGLHTLIGYGVAVELVASGASRFDTMRDLAQHLYARAQGDAPPLFGGFAFNDEHTPQVVWEGMHAAQFVIPQVLIADEGDAGRLIVSEYVPADGDTVTARERLQTRCETLLDDIFWNTPPHTFDPEWDEASSIEYPMSADDWGRMITNATDQMGRGLLDKVVLARMAQVRFAKPVNVLRALAYLREHYANTYRFLFEPAVNTAFYGATPETLISWQDNTDNAIFADALAGTVKRGDTPEADAALAAQILNDPKERREHDYVVQGLRERLAPFVESVMADDTPGLMKLSNVQHLHTPVTGTLREPVDVFTLLKVLHPTPALGGTPREVAADLIDTLEPITRGWYAAPIGWVTPELRGRFGVGIRSAVSRGGTLWAYAGAGIVEESQPEREWRETDLKFRPMLNAVGITV